MIFDIDSGKRITRDPFLREYNIWRNRLSEEEYAAIEVKINEMIDGNEVHTASWMPGNNWEGTVFEPIYTKACGMNEEDSGRCFGLFIWYIFQNRTDEWFSGNFEKDGVPIKSRTYFRKRN